MMLYHIVNIIIISCHIHCWDFSRAKRWKHLGCDLHGGRADAHPFLCGAHPQEDALWWRQQTFQMRYSYWFADIWYWYVLIYLIQSGKQPVSLLLWLYQLVHLCWNLKLQFWGAEVELAWVARALEGWSSAQISTPAKAWTFLQHLRRNSSHCPKHRIQLHTSTGLHVSACSEMMTLEGWHKVDICRYTMIHLRHIDDHNRL